MLAFSSAQAANPYIPDLHPDAPQCMVPEAKRPKFGVDFKHDLPTEIKANFMGIAGAITPLAPITSKSQHECLWHE